MARRWRGYLSVRRVPWLSPQVTGAGWIARSTGGTQRERRCRKAALQQGRVPSLASYRPVGGFSETVAMTPALRSTITRALTAGTVASLFSAAALMVCGRRETGSSAAPINAVSHWYWREEALYFRQTDIKHTLLGYLTHHGASVFWGGAVCRGAAWATGSPQPGRRAGWQHGHQCGSLFRRFSTNPGAAHARLRTPSVASVSCGGLWGVCRGACGGCAAGGWQRSGEIKRGRPRRRTWRMFRVGAAASAQQLFERADANGGLRRPWHHQHVVARVRGHPFHLLALAMEARLQQGVRRAGCQQ